jgi:hypothetical protein
VPEKEAQETVETADVKAAVEDEVPNEHREELANTIGDALSTLNEKE